MLARLVEVKNWLIFNPFSGFRSLCVFGSLFRPTQAAISPQDFFRLPVEQIALPPAKVCLISDFRLLLYQWILSVTNPFGPPAAPNIFNSWLLQNPTSRLGILFHPPVRRGCSSIPKCHSEVRIRMEQRHILSFCFP